MVTPGHREAADIGIADGQIAQLGGAMTGERELDAGGFFFPAAKKETMVRNIRAMILRSQLSDQQARTIRGMIVALVKNKYRGQKKEE